jgi:sugar phosphate isomerase/epimerase
MKLSVNTVLFGGYDLETAFKHIAMAGYDGVELSALDGMSQHLVLDRSNELIPEILRLSKIYQLELLAIQQGSSDPARIELAFQAASALGIPVVHCDPSGRSDNEADFQKNVDDFTELSRLAERYGVSLCLKAHIGKAIYNTPTILRILEVIASPAFGVNIDPSHLYRVGEDPVAAVAAVLPRLKHVHFRDCKGRQQGPGKPEMQANGRGDIDLLSFVQVAHQGGYKGALSLEIIGAKDYSLVQCAVIAAESRGHMQACLQACGAR